MILYGDGDERARAWIRGVVDRGLALAVPAPVLAQVWRGDTRHVWLNRLVKEISVVPFDERFARLAGALLAATATADVVNAAVAVTAADLGHYVLTADRDDLTALVAPLKRVKVLTV